MLSVDERLMFCRQLSHGTPQNAHDLVFAYDFASTLRKALDRGSPDVQEIASNAVRFSPP